MTLEYDIDDWSAAYGVPLHHTYPPTYSKYVERREERGLAIGFDAFG